MFLYSGAAFGKNSVESQARFSAAAQACYNGELAVRYVNIDIFQIVYSGSDYREVVEASVDMIFSDISLFYPVPVINFTVLSAALE